MIFNLALVMKLYPFVSLSVNPHGDGTDIITLRSPDDGGGRVARVRQATSLQGSRMCVCTMMNRGASCLLLS